MITTGHLCAVVSAFLKANNLFEQALAIEKCLLRGFRFLRLEFVRKTYSFKSV